MRPISSRIQRAFFAAVVVVTALVTFAALGGLGVPISALSAAQYEYGPPEYQYGVVICHSGPGESRVTITVSVAAVRAHLSHGDTVGPCT